MSKSKKQTFSTNDALYEAPTPQQLAEIDRYRTLCRTYAAAINHPWSYLITITSTTLLFSILVNREHAPFHESYLKLLDNFFSRFRPYELSKLFVDTSQHEIAEGLKTVDKNCLEYYYFLKNEWSNYALNSFNLDPERIQKLLRGGVFGEESLPPLDAERMLAILYKDEELAVEIIRKTCLTFSESFMENAGLPRYVFQKILNGNTNVQELRLYELFQATDKLVELARNFTVSHFKILLSKGDQYDRFMTLERQSGIINLFKMAIIGLSKYLVVSPTLNYFFPFGLRSQSQRTAPSHKPGFLTHTTAAEEISALQTYEQTLQKKTAHYSQLTNKLFLILAGGALLFLFACGLSNIPGELGFFLVSVVASMIYQIFSLAKQQVQQYYTKKQIQHIHQLLRETLSTYCQISQYQTANVVQFHLRVRDPKCLMILKRCFETHSIRIVSSNKKEMIINCDSRLTKKTLGEIAQQVKQASDRLANLNNVTKLLNQIQSHCSLNKKLITEIYFDAKGYPSATWYLSTDHEQIAQKITELSDSNTCFVQQNESGATIITINDNITVNDCNQLNLEIQACCKSDKKPSFVSFPPHDYSDQNSPLSPSTKLKRRTINDKKSPERKETSPKEETALPSPYSEAKRMKASFLPSDANIWALFALEEDDFPTNECYQKFQELLLLPTIVAPTDQQGLVFDEELSQPGQRHFKAKVLGTYGMFRLKAKKIEKIRSKDGEIHQVHIFNELVLAHT